MMESLRARVMWMFALISLVGAWSPSQSFTDVSSECRNAISVGDPVCANGGTLHSDNSSQPVDCASCDCPDGWRGVDCSLCRDVSVCPSIIGEGKQEVFPTACPVQRLVPNAEELRKGKIISCDCGGDADTQLLCNMLPETRILINITQDGNGPLQKGHVKLYAGVPSADTDPVPSHLQYAFPGYWEAFFTGCSWSQRRCQDPLPRTSECLFLTCPNGEVFCPPKNVPPCPGYNTFPFLCDEDEPGHRPWQHHCNPLIVPDNSSVSFYCLMQPNTTGPNGPSNLCYFRQPSKASIALTCHTGQCLYEPNDAPQPVPPPDKTPLVSTQTVSLLCMVVGALLVLIGTLIHGRNEWLSESDLAVLIAQAQQQGSDSSLPGASSASSLPPSTPAASAPPSTGADAGAGAGPSAQSRRSSVGQRQQPAVLAWTDLCCAVALRNGAWKEILRGVSGVSGTGAPRESGEPFDRDLTAILGPSGAGKTTLLDVLAGRVGRQYEVTGSVELNGRAASPRELRLRSGYVLQDDVLPGTSTVLEYLAFHAELRLPHGTPLAEKQERVAGVMAALGLAKLAGSFIGDQLTRGLSGGEKRRLSIAVELLTRPSVMFLDEPTTGLDSTNAATVVGILASLADEGVSVIVSLHQPRPDVFRLLSRVVLLSGDGAAVYSGPTEQAAAHLASMGLEPPGPDVHVADFMLDVVIKSPPERVAEMIECFDRSLVADQNTLRTRLLRQQRADAAAAGAADAYASQHHESPSLREFAAPFSVQLRVLCGRLLRNVYRHPLYLWLNFAATFAMAACLGLLFRSAGVDTGGIQDRLGALFFMLLYLSTMSLGSLPAWSETRALFLRERAAGAYGSNAYFLAVVLFDFLPLRVLPPCFFGMLSYPLIGLRSHCHFCLLYFVGVLVAANLATTAICMAVGALVQSVAVANVASILLLLVSALFGGLLVNRDELPGRLRWALQLSPFAAAFEMLVVNEFGGSDVNFWFTSDVNSTVFPAAIPVTGDQVLTTFGFDARRVPADWGTLAGTVCASLLLCYAFIRAREPWANDARAPGRRRRRAAAGETAAACQGNRAATAAIASLVRATATAVRHAGAADDDENAALTHPLLDGGEVAADLEGAGVNGGVGNGYSGEYGDDESRGYGYADGDDGVDAAIRRAAGAGGASSSARGTATRFGVAPGTPGGAAEDARRRLLQARSAAVLSWEQVTCSLHLPPSGRRRRRERVILRDVSGLAGPVGGAASAGLAAILGPSGAGKTTLLDILAGRPVRQAKVTGSVELNGRAVSARQLRHRSGYVLQDDMFPGTSTVQEYLAFHAELRLPADVPAAERRERVAAVMEALGLLKVADSFIGDQFRRGLSGGEKRRLSIAAELLTRPSVMFLDEPTTGLDSTNAAAVVGILSGLADEGVTVVLSLHQPRPDVFRLLTRIVLLSGDGAMVYSGPAQRAARHFASLGLESPGPEVHVADFMLDVVIKSPPERVAEMVDAYRSSEAAGDNAVQIAQLRLPQAYHRGGWPPSSAAAGPAGPRSGQLPHSKYSASFAKQLRVLCGRLLRNAYRHPVHVWLNFAAALATFLALGVVFRRADVDTGGIQDRLGALFFTLLYLSLMSLGSLPVWTDDRALFLRERAAGCYGANAYFCAVVLFDLLPLRVLPPLLFCAPYALIGLRPGRLALARAYAALVGANASAAACCMLIGLATRNNALANGLGSFVILLSALLGGFFVSNKDLSPAELAVARFSYFHPAFEALAVNEFYGRDGFFFTSRISRSARMEVTGDVVLGTFGFEPSDRALQRDLLSLPLFAVRFLVVTFLLLKFVR